MNLLRLLRHRYLATLWISQVFSAMGDHFYDLAVVWVAVNVAGSGAGLVVAASALTHLAVGMLGGVLADRWDRRRAMVAADLLRALTVGILPILAHAGQLRLWHLAVASAVLAALSSLFNPALLASLPTLAKDRTELQALTALMDGTWRLALAVAPSMAGLLVAVLPIAQFFTLDAISFLASALAIAALGQHLRRRPSPETAQPRPSMVREALGAIQLVRAHPLLGWYIATTGVSALAWSAAFRVGLALLAARTLGGGVGAYGLLLGAYGVGNILSNLVVGSLTIHRQAAALVGAGYVLVAVAPTLWGAMLGTAISAIGGPMADIMVQTIIQRDLPGDQIGKVYSLLSTVEYGGTGIGLLLSGPLFAVLAPRVGIAVCAAVIAATGVIGLTKFGWRGLAGAAPSHAIVPSAQREED